MFIYGCAGSWSLRGLLLVAGSRGPSLVVVPRLLTAPAFPDVSTGSWARGLQYLWPVSSVVAAPGL